MKKLIALFTAFIVTFSLSQAQTWKEKVEMMEKRVQEKLENQRQIVELKFSNQMRRVWLEAQLQGGLEPPPVPKPVNPTIYDPSIKFDRDEDNELLIDPYSEPDPAITPKTPEPVRVPDLAPEPAPRAEIPDWRGKSSLMEDRIARLSTEVEASYFGQQVTFRYDPRMKFQSSPYITENKIADQWAQLDASQYELLLYQIGKYANLMQLNDWGYALLVNRAARQLFPRDKNARTLFNWFCLSKSGYISTVCYRKDELFLMLPSQHILYGKSYLKGENGLKYYAIDLDGRTPNLRQVKVFNHRYPEAKRKLNFEMPKAPNLDLEPVRRNIEFSYKGKDYRFPVVANKNVISFYATYPFMDLEVYMQAPLSKHAKHSLVKALRKEVQDMPEEEGVNFLLRFVQKGFGYKSDQDQFGRERYLFAEETLYYPYSDCEDRSVLFAYLTREILGLEVVGLLFPGHAATAVRFADKSIGGDHITYRGAKYIICDPTYINAEIGMVLPEYKNEKAKIVRY